jgi:hypothetical protein
MLAVTLVTGRMKDAPMAQGGVLYAWLPISTAWKLLIPTMYSSANRIPSLLKESGSMEKETVHGPRSSKSIVTDVGLGSALDTGGATPAASAMRDTTRSVRIARIAHSPPFWRER